MIYYVNWRDEQHTVVQIDIVGDWRWDIADRAFYDAYMIISEVRYGVVVVLNLMDTQQIPDPALDQIERLFASAPRNVAKLIIVTDHENVEWYFSLANNRAVSLVRTLDNLF